MATIIFGPTGRIGSSAALSLQTLNKTPPSSPIILAMRDTTKPMPGLTAELEASLSAKRVRADLCEADSIRAAVESTGAKRAFLYLTPLSPDFMLGAIEALKSSGIEFVVYISSLGVGSDLDDVDPATVAYKHAQVEKNLRKIFGATGYVALRPGMFISNSVMFWRAGILAGEVRLYAGDYTADWIVPADIGRVAAAILAGGKVPDGVVDNVVNVMGPEEMSMREVIRVLAGAAGKTVQIVDVDEAEGLSDLIAMGLPPPVAEKVIEMYREGISTGKGVRNLLKGADHQEAVGTIEKYTGRRGMTVAEWAEENKGLFM